MIQENTLKNVVCDMPVNFCGGGGGGGGMGWTVKRTLIQLVYFKEKLTKIFDTDPT